MTAGYGSQLTTVEQTPRRTLVGCLRDEIAMRTRKILGEKLAIQRQAWLSRLTHSHKRKSASRASELSARAMDAIINFTNARYVCLCAG